MKRNQKTMKKHMLRNAWSLISYALALVLVMGATFGMTPAREAIAETLGATQTPAGDGSITIYLQDQEDAPVAGAKVYLFHVGDWNDAGSWDLTGDFVDASTDLSQASTAAGMETAVAELLTYAEEQAIAGVVATTDDQGVVAFTGLAEGLYMVMQDGMEPGAEAYRDFPPFLISVPQMTQDGESQHAAAYPKTEKEPETSTEEITSTEETSSEVPTEPDTESSAEEESSEPGTEATTEAVPSTEETGSDIPGESTASGETVEVTPEETVPNTGGEGDPQLPITGMVVWPITVFSILGLVLFMIGWADNRVCKMRERNDER